MFETCQRISYRSMKKYLSGIRWQHLALGFPWTMKKHPLIAFAKRALLKQFPGSKTLKIPLSLHTARRLCEAMPGWPTLGDLSFDDLLWATATSIMVLSAQRGGQVFTYPSSNRPILRGELLSVIGLSASRPDSFSSAPRVQVLVEKPKTALGVKFAICLAVDPPYGRFPLRPSVLLTEYRARCARIGLPVLGRHPALRLRDGRPLFRDFMVGRASRLASRAGLLVLGPDGKAVPFLASSWRAGYKLSAQAAGISDFIVGQTGTWSTKSISGSVPYSFASVLTLQKTAKQLVDAMDEPDASFELGQFNDEGMFEHTSLSAPSH